MAPSKKAKNETTTEVKQEVKPISEVGPSRRVTRSLTRPADTSLPPPPQAPPKKKAKKGSKSESEVPPPPAAVEKDDGGEVCDDDSTAKAETKTKTKTIVIERCTQCNQFKKRALLVKEGLESKIPGITVLHNPEKPRRGCFEIREEGGDTFISLLGLKRPFTPMIQLDMQKVISDIVAKIQV